MARDKAPRLSFAQFWPYILAFVAKIFGAAVEKRAASRLCEQLDFAAYGLVAASLRWVWHQNCGKQHLGIGVQRLGAQIGGIGNFHQIAQIHYADSVANVFDYSQIVGDKQIR